MEVAITPSGIMSVEDIRPDLWYRRSAFSNFRFHRGRLLSDALLHDPVAPISVQNPRQPKQFFVFGSDVLAYLASYDAPLDVGTVQKQRESDLANMKKRIENTEEYMRLAIEECEASARKRYDEKLRDFGSFRASMAGVVMEHLKRETIDITKPASLSCGVYFLKHEGQIVYVGQSISVYSRVSAHRRDKTFDMVSFLPCKREELNNLEGFFIRLLMPKLNGHGREGAHGAPASKLWQDVVELEVRAMNE
jgi:hypothetical protein